MEGIANKFKNRIGKQFKEVQVKELSYDGQSRKISGYAAVFNSVDKVGDVLIRGCFSKSIAERGPESQANDKIIFLWQHDMREPIGRITELKEDEHGLYFEAEIDDVERGNQTLKQLESGTLNQFSIGFQYVWDKCEYDGERDTFIVKEVILYEISVVSIGCNGETEYLGLKSTDDPAAAYEALTKEIDALCKELSIRQREAVQNVIRKAMSLAAVKPNESLGTKKQADDENRKYDLFNSIKLKKDD